MIFNTHYPYIGGAGGGGGGGMPKFEYTGQYSFIDDGNGNWRIKFLTSGVFKTLKSMTIDVFLVGGGGGASAYSGGGGGYTNTRKEIKLSANVEYPIAIGAGGKPFNSGGESSAFGETASGGGAANGKTSGGNGGSGGGGYGNNRTGAAGGADGANGASSTATGGTGQGTTTREFGETAGELYAGGGGGGVSGSTSFSGGAGGAGGGGNGAKYKSTGSNGEANTGGGGGGGGGVVGGTQYLGGAGGSGIAIIRNAR